MVVIRLLDNVAHMYLAGNTISEGWDTVVQRKINYNQDE